MKKIISILVVLCLIGTLVPFAMASEQSQVDFWLSADPHLQSINRVGDVSVLDGYSETALYYDASIQGQMKNISQAVFQQFLNEYLDSDVEILLIAGDLTLSGHVADHTVFALMLQDTLDKAKNSGKEKRIFVINGNHDIVPGDEEKCQSAEAFKACYRNFGYAQALATDDNSCSYTADLNGEYRLLALDSCVYGKDYGYFEDERLTWIEKQVEQAKKDGKTLVTMMHHSLLYHFNVQDMMEDCEYFATLFADMGITHVFTGHMHGNDIAEAVTENGNKIYDIMTGSLITAPCSYRKVVFSKQAVDIKTDYVTKVDVNSLPEGLNEAQYELITTDFSAYAKGYFAAGMRAWLNRYIGSAAVVAKKLKIDSNSKAYEAIDYVLSCVNNVLELPLYSENEDSQALDSIEKLTKAYGYTLPETDYTGTNEVVAKVIGDFFAGDENMDANSPEIRILYAVISAGIVKAVSDMLTGGKDSEITKALFDAVEVRTDVLSCTGLGKMIAGKAVANTLVRIIMEPIVTGITADEYTPGDLNVTLEGAHAMTQKSVSPSPLSFLQRVKNYFAKIIEILKNTLPKAEVL